MINISKNKCIGCGTCAKVCPEGIEIVNGVAKIKNPKATCLKNIIMVCPQHAIKDIRGKLLFAIGTDDGLKIKSDDHVGMSQYYSIWEYSDGQMNFKEKRKNIQYREKAHGDPEKAKKVASVLDNVDVIVGKMIGPNIVRMKEKFVFVVIREPLIKNALKIIKENINEIMDEKEKNLEEKQAIILR